MHLKGLVSLMFTAHLPSFRQANANHAVHERLHPDSNAVRVLVHWYCGCRWFDEVGHRAVQGLGSLTLTVSVCAKEHSTSLHFYELLTQLRHFSQTTSGCRFFLRDQILRRGCMANLAEMYGIIEYIAVAGWFLKRLYLEARVVETRVINALDC